MLTHRKRVNQRQPRADATEALRKPRLQARDASQSQPGPEQPRRSDRESHAYKRGRRVWRVAATMLIRDTA